MEKSLFILFLFALFTINLSSQICEGNLGENIFTQGDFGSGSSNILLNDPGLTLGYEYTIFPPPNDGQFTITNDMSKWLANFGWVVISDNSPDPFGYMMVVNASYEPGSFYDQQVEGLCENTLYEFSADFFNLIHSGENLIKPRISFLLDEDEVYNSGPIPENEQWNTYGFTFTTNPGQTILILTLKNDAPGGIGNDLAIDNISFRPCGPEALILPEEIENICEDGSPINLEATIIGTQYPNPAIQWQQSFDEGQSWIDIPGENDVVFTHNNLSSGYYYYRYLLANSTDNLLNAKCRIVSNSKIIHVVPKFFEIQDTLCEGLVFTVGNSTYSSSGTFTDSLISSIGCDSIIKLDLTILPDDGIQAQFQVKDLSCSYSEDGIIEIDTVLNAFGNYALFFNGLSFPINGNLSNIPAGEYSFSVTDEIGCAFDTSIILLAPDPFIIDLGPDQTVDLGSPVYISASPENQIADYFWEADIPVDCPVDCSTLEWFPTSSMYLYLTAYSEQNCEAIDSVFIRVIVKRDVYIPNVFTPNSDGINDTFTIFGSSPNIQSIESLNIYDRWGSMVFHAEKMFPNDLESGWDGHYNNRTAGIGVYTYFAKIRFLDGAILPYTGTVSLMR